ncbi:SDR family NAD(P)-dependent oxidoreductase [Streptomyces sp. NBC_00102]|nr:SDR family NAD(P)-dependent oxidoreductase [Streptomyces sp. NBC_00102]
MTTDHTTTHTALNALANNTPHPNLITGHATTTGKTALVFPGQGTQWNGMGAQLLDTSPTFAHHIHTIEQALTPYTDWKLTDVIRQHPNAPTLDRVDVVQPTTFALMTALAHLWHHQGITPHTVIGHSQGEIAAAHIAGALTLQDAAKIVTLRSQAIATTLTGHGGMLHLTLPHQETTQLIQPWTPHAQIAALNGPHSTVIAGNPTTLQEIKNHCTTNNIQTRTIPVDYASHTTHVEKIKDTITTLLADIKPTQAHTPYYSTLEQQYITDTTTLTAEYWYRNLRHTVQFHNSIKNLIEQNHRTFIETSPHPVLTPSIQNTLENTPHPTLTTPTLTRHHDTPHQLLTATATLHTHTTTHPPTPTQTTTPHTNTPTYPFQHKNYWLEPVRTGATGLTGAGVDPAGHPMLGTFVELPDDGGTVAAGRLSTRTHTWLADHAVSGQVLVPGSGIVELAIRTGDEVGAGLLEELVIESPLTLDPGVARRVRVVVGAADAEGRRAVGVHSGPGESDGSTAQWTRHAAGVLGAGGVTGAGSADADLALWPPVGAVAVDLGDFYDRKEREGYGYGPAFRGLRAVWTRGEEVFAEVRLPEELREEAESFGLHPALLDAALHACGFAAPEDAEGGVRLPFAWNDVALHAFGAAALRVHVTRLGEDTVALALADETGAPVATVGTLTFRTAQAGSGTGVTDSLFATVWLPVAEPVQDGEDSAETRTVDTSAWAAEFEDQPVRVRELTGRLLGELREWDARAGSDSSRLVVVTRGAVSAVAGDQPDPSAAALWGLLRTAQAEHPGRIVAIDTDEDLPADRTRSLAALGEPQLALRGTRLSVPRLARRRHGNEDAPATRLDPEGSVLVTGGTGTLGTLVARHLVSNHGIRHLVLVSRRGPAAEGAPELVAELEALGASATVAACDVSDPGELDKLLSGIPAEHRLTAVVHTSGVLDDGMLADLTPERFDTVLRPKADAAWHLHTRTEHLGLAAFVLFSSAAGVLGSPGQANYAAANGFLDGLAEYRHARGLPAVSLAWGLWSEASGMTTHLADTDRGRLSRRGAVPLGSDEGLALFDAALRSSEALLMPARLDFASLGAQAADGNLSPLLRRMVRQPRRAAGQGGPAGTSLSDRLTALTESDRLALLVQLVSEQVSDVLGLPPEEAVDPDQAFKEIGFDSMLAVELRNRLARGTGVRLPVTLVFDYPTPAVLAAELRRALLPGIPAEEEPAEEADDETSRTLDLIASMDVDDLVARALGTSSTDTHTPGEAS